MPRSLCLCFPSCHGGTQPALDLSSPTFPHGKLQIGTPPLVLSPRLCILPQESHLSPGTLAAI